MLTRGSVKRLFGISGTAPVIEAKVRDMIGGLAADHQRGMDCAVQDILDFLHKMERRMNERLEALLGAVEAQQTKIDSLITLTDGLRKQVLDAMGETITPSQKMRIDQVFDAVSANSSDIDAALKANTVDATAGAITDGPSAADIKAAELPTGEKTAI